MGSGVGQGRALRFLISQRGVYLHAEPGLGSWTVKHSLTWAARLFIEYRLQHFSAMNRTDCPLGSSSDSESLSCLVWGPHVPGAAQGQLLALVLRVLSW